jgi:hypothetical protein
MARAFTVRISSPACGVYRSIVHSRPIDLDTNILTTGEPGGPLVKKMASIHLSPVFQTTGYSAHLSLHHHRQWLWLKVAVCQVWKKMTMLCTRTDT